MRATPPIPPWIKEFRDPSRPIAFMNAFELMPSQTRLYATETLFGDWDAAVLLLAQDAMPWSTFQALHQREGDSGWRHAVRSRDQGGWKTNEKLCSLVNTYLSGHACLYGSAAAHMLSVGTRYRHGQANRMHGGGLGEHLQETLMWVLTSLPNLRAVACLGQEAWNLTCATLERPELRDKIELRDQGHLISQRCDKREIVLSFHYHPVATNSPALHELSWIALQRAL